MTLDLETDRLILRPLAPGDFEAHAAMMADPDVAKFLTADRKTQPDFVELARQAGLSIEVVNN